MWRDYDGSLQLDQDDIARIAEERGIDVEDVTPQMMFIYGEENSWGVQ